MATTKTKDAPKASTKPTETKAVKAVKSTIAMDAKAADVDKLITSIKGRGAKLDTDVHSAAMACLYHADKHGDITLMARLVLALPKSARRNALGQWAIAFGKFAANEDAKTKEAAPFVFKKGAETKFEAAQAKPFWDFRNVREGTTEWQFSNYIEGVLKTLAAHAAKPGPEAAKAKAAFDAMKGVTEALAVPAPEVPAAVAVKPETERRAPAVH
jgi:hypothetical protein